MGWARKLLRIKGPSLKEKFTAAIGGPTVAAAIHAGPASLLQLAAAHILASKKVRHALGAGTTEGIIAGSSIGFPIPSFGAIVGGVLGATLPKKARPVAFDLLGAIGGLGGSNASSSGGLGGIIGSIGGLIQGQQLVKSQKALAKAQVRALDRLGSAELTPMPPTGLPGMGIPGAIQDIFSIITQGGPGAAGRSGGGGATAITPMPTRSGTIRGPGGRRFRMNRQGQWVPARRHLNPVNFHALKRAGRRIHMFMKLVRPFLSYERKKTVRSTFRLRAGRRRRK